MPGGALPRQWRTDRHIPLSLQELPACCGRTLGGVGHFRSSEFAFSAGQPTRFRSSPAVIRTFCSQCGTSLTYQRDTEPDTVDVTTASLDFPDDFAPTREIWVAHKLAWEQLNDNFPQYPGSSRQA